MLLLLIIVFILFPLATLLHELGHYITARLIGAKNIEIKMGLGNRIIKLKEGPDHLEVRLFFFIGGSTLWEGSNCSRPIEKLFISLNGPMTNFMIAFITFLVASFVRVPYLEAILDMFIYVNLWIGVGNLIPYKFRNRKSDGWVVFQSLYTVMHRSSSHQ